MKFQHILKCVEKYYSEKIITHGPTARGVDWNSADSQVLRFEQLLRICDTTQEFSINDYGCGYGALAGYLANQGLTFRYKGFDISSPMIAHARKLHPGSDSCEFFSDESHLPMADYTVASGIFNVKLQVSDEEWQTYVLDILGKMAALSEKGVAFNMLTLYSDPEYRRADLYYADPTSWFDHCKRHFSKFVALLHDYPLYEFTILVRK